MKSAGFLTTALSINPIKALGNIEKDLGEEEAHLRNYISILMQETNFKVAYYKVCTVPVSVQAVDYKMIIGFDMPIKKLQEIKSHLNMWAYFAKKHKGDGVIRIYDFKESSTRDVYYYGTAPYPYA